MVLYIFKNAVDEFFLVTKGVGAAKCSPYACTYLADGARESIRLLSFPGYPWPAILPDERDGIARPAYVVQDPDWVYDGGQPSNSGGARFVRNPNTRHEPLLLIVLDQ